jgi:signal transduction histidine kinase
MTAEHDLFPRAMSLAVHELRTPVTVVAGYLRMLLREQAGPLTDKQRKMLEEADRSCARLGAIVAEMSELAKLEAQQTSMARQDIDVDTLLAELATGMHEGGDRGVRLEHRNAGGLAVVAGDRARLAAAFSALMRAALRERGEPGVIVVQSVIRNEFSPPRVIVGIADESTIATLLDASAAQPAFDEWRGGLGMALPIARRVIEAHGGMVWSGPGAQARAAVAVQLPLRTVTGSPPR